MPAQCAVKIIILASLGLQNSPLLTHDDETKRELTNDHKRRSGRRINAPPSYPQRLPPSFNSNCGTVDGAEADDLREKQLLVPVHVPIVQERSRRAPLLIAVDVDRLTRQAPACAGFSARESTRNAGGGEGWSKAAQLRLGSAHLRHTRAGRQHLRQRAVGVGFGRERRAPSRRLGRRRVRRPYQNPYL